MSGNETAEWTHQKQKKEQMGGATGLGRITREQIGKWNQMTALGFQTGGKHQKFPASLRGARVYISHKLLLLQIFYSGFIEVPRIEPRRKTKY